MTASDGRRVLTCAGLIIAPSLWAIGTELGLVLPQIDCSAHLPAAGAVAFLATLLVLIAGYVSWHNPWPGHTGLFTARLCALLALVFAFALVVQLGAGLMLTGCER
jgi:hypothetical protein